MIEITDVVLERMEIIIEKDWTAEEKKHFVKTGEEPFDFMSLFSEDVIDEPQVEEDIVEEVKEIEPKEKSVFDIMEEKRQERINSPEMQELLSDAKKLHDFGKKLPTYKIDGVLTEEYRVWVKESTTKKIAFKEKHGSNNLVILNMYKTWKLAKRSLISGRTPKGNWKNNKGCYGIEA